MRSMVLIAKKRANDGIRVAQIWACRQRTRTDRGAALHGGRLAERAHVSCRGADALTRVAGVMLLILVSVAAAIPVSATERGVLAPIVRASMRAEAPAQPSTRETLGDALGRWGDSANRALFGFNAWLYTGWNSLMPSGPPSPVGAAVVAAAANLFANWINEPLTIVSYAAAGRLDDAGLSGRRFLVNTFRGWGGVRDRATEMGLVVPRMDIGLALCALGIGGGPYVVVPVVGPRTWRDGLSDLVAVNGMVYLALLPLGLPTATVVLIMVGDEVVHLALMRQIDAVPTEDAVERDFDSVRADYLAERVERCEQLRGRPAPRS